MKGKMLFLVSLMLLPFNVFAATEPNKSNTSEVEFAGLKFGVGISITHDVGSIDRVTSASLDGNGIVRVNKEQNDVARIMLETHYFFEGGRKVFGLWDAPEAGWAWGPFIALQPGTSDIIEAIGGGIMIGFRKSRASLDSFNIGFGLILDPSVQVLGDGITENQPLPSGETEIRYKETSQGGLLGLFSFTF